IVFAKRFDLERLETVGEEVSVIGGVRRGLFVGGGGTGSAYFDVSNSGSMAYIQGPSTISLRYDLGLLDPATGVTPLQLMPNAYEVPRVSPDGKSIAVGIVEGNGANVLIYDRTTGAPRQLTSAGRNRYPVWSPDGIWVAFQSDREGDLGIWRQRADGSGTA